MKELTSNEMQYASGGILFAVGGGLLGGAVGSLIDWIIPGDDHFSWADTGLSFGLMGGGAVDALNVVGGLGALAVGALAVGAVGVGVVGAAAVGVGLLCLTPLMFL